MVFAACVANGALYVLKINCLIGEHIAVDAVQALQSALRMFLMIIVWKAA